jgi:hypothetical protein
MGEIHVYKNYGFFPVCVMGVNLGSSQGRKRVFKRELSKMKQLKILLQVSLQVVTIYY